jgi:hypothetical protein
MTGIAPDTALSFLRHLYDGTDTGWLSTFSVDRATGEQVVRWAPVDQPERLIDEVLELPTTSCVWFGVATRQRKLMGKRGGAADCRELPALWLDIDIAGPAHHQDNLPPDRAAAKAIVERFPLAPTAVIDSGNGLQAWWQLDEPISADQAPRLLARWQATWERLAAPYHLDNVSDVPRVMRLPGTLNNKVTPTPVRVLFEDWARRYGATDIDELLDEPAPAPAPTPSTWTGGEGLPGQVFNARHTGSEILTRLGFTHSHRTSDGDHYIRPGKTKGSSATVYDDGHTTIWSDTVLHQWPALAKNRPYDPFGLYACTQHGGDFTSAAIELERQGYGSRSTLPELDDLFATALTTTEREPEVAEVVPIRPLVDRKPLPTWPTHVLPPWVRAHVEACSARLQVPTDLCAQLAVGVLASACMGRATVQLDTWTETLNLYTYIAMHSGAGKSPAEKAIVRPLRDWEANRRVSTHEDHRFALAAWKVTQKRYKDMEDSVVRGSIQMDDPEYRKLILEAAESKPVEYRLTVDDATPERLVQLLAQHQRLALISTEAGLLDMVAGQISRGGTPNIDVYLKAWSGETIQRDRKGGDEGPESTVVTDALLSVVLTIQPSVVAKYQATSPELRGRGFFARFMPSVPQSLVGTRTHGNRTHPGPEADEYRDRLHALADTMAATLPVQLTPNDAAAAMFYRWCDSMEVQLLPGQRLAALHDASSKIKSSVLRVAGLLTLAEGEFRSIDQVTMAHAIEVGDYWIEHALYVEGASEATEVEDEHAVRMARAIVEFARAKEVLELEPRQVYLSRRRGLNLRGVEDLAPGFDLLITRGWARLTEGSVGDIGVPRVKVRARLDPVALDGFTESDRALTESAQPRAMRADCLIGEKSSSSSFSRIEGGHPPDPPQSARIARAFAPTGTDGPEPVDNPDDHLDAIKDVF